MRQSDSDCRDGGQLNYQRPRSSRSPRPRRARRPRPRSRQSPLPRFRTIVPLAPSVLAGLAALAVAIPAPAVAQDPDRSEASPVPGQPKMQEAFLERLMGTWSVATETLLGPGQEPVHSEGRAVARRVGVWLVTETTGTTPDGRPVTSLFTLGYDTAEERFRGTWISSMQTHSWEYTGELDESGTVLTLETEGPILGDPTTSAEYREIFEVGDDDRYVVRSLIRGPDGEWFTFARAVHRRGE